ncbi:hypothetical protein H106_02658 [Trichophyton rubrum CBS 735.88]|nr:hypothetical protein H106_02658 [Trichophyton rubrum CBS 735.88]
MAVTESHTDGADTIIPTSAHGKPPGDPVLLESAMPEETPQNAPLHRTLKSRHLQMIAIGGIIGPGLLVGSGNALHVAGPAGILISFTLVGILVFFVM